MTTASLVSSFNLSNRRAGILLVMALPLLCGIAQAQVVNASPSNGLQYFPTFPCRVVDTRNANGPFGGPPIQGGTSRSFPIPQSICEIPANAAAYVFTVTAIPNGQLSLLTAYPTGESRGAVTTMVSLDGRIKSDPAIVPAGTNGAISIYASNTTNVVVDFSGFFASAAQGGLQFFPLPPCRLVDTRNANGPLGGPSLQGNQERDFPLLQSPCIPQGITPAAYSLNFAAIPMNGTLNYLTAWQTGEPLPLAFTLTDPTGAVLADMGIVAAGSSGSIAVYPSNNTNLVIDINGFFASPASGGLSLYTTAAPCHAYTSQRSALDRGFSGTIVVPVSSPGNPCALPSSSQAFVFNATVYPARSIAVPDSLGQRSGAACCRKPGSRGWICDFKHGDCADDQWLYRCLRPRHDAIESRHHELLCAVEANDTFRFGRDDTPISRFAR